MIKGRIINASYTLSFPFQPDTLLVIIYLPAIWEPGLFHS